MNPIIPLALLFLARRRSGMVWPEPPAPPSPPWSPPASPPAAPPTAPPAAPPTAPPAAPPTDDQPPARAARYATIRRGEGPYQFVARVCGQQYAARWKHLLDVNPSVRLNRKGDNVTNASWRPGDQIRIPDDWPGGESRVAGLDTV